MWRIVFMLACSAVASAAEPLPEILWHRPDYPPTFILSGPWKDQGFGDRRELDLIKALSGYRHRRMPSNVSRLMQEYQLRANVCTTALLKTAEREQRVIYSEPVLEQLPNGLITLLKYKADFEPFLNERGEVKLAALVQSGKVRISVAADRSYGATIDAALQAGHQSGAVRAFFKGDIFASGLQRLGQQGEVDATLGMAIEMNWVIGRLGLPEKEYWFVPIAGETGLVRTYVACSRGTQGQAIIDEVNRLLRTTGMRAEFAHAYMEWLPENLRSHYRQVRAGTVR